ncbi:MAG: MmgE/PrpD family protein [Chloroflexi bacterium]|nr:MmgE/PrpD family protein [Chloroflexota bacterium]
MEKSIARQLAEYGLGLSFKELPPEVVHQAKRCVLDSIACAFGGYGGESSRIIQGAIEELGGPDEATIIGSGKRTSCLNAALANGLMVRYLDYNDFYRKPQKKMKPGAHPSEVIPPTLALAERQKSNGQDVVVAVVLGYELANRFMDVHGTMETSLEEKGWNDDCRGAFVIPVVAGRLMGLTAEQIENAVGISGSHSMVMRILDAPGEEYTMTKSLRFPFTAFAGIQAAILARRGFTGPVRVIEGCGGYREVVMRGNYDLSLLTDNTQGFRIMHVGVKPFPCEGTNHGHLCATLKLVKDNDIKPEDVERVLIKATERTAEHSGDPVKKHPHNKETADHSAYYMTAVAILDRTVSPAQFLPNKINDPKVHELIDRVTVEPMPELNEFRDAGISTITTKQGKSYTLRIDYPKGHPRNPMTDQEIEEKFRSMASAYLGDKRMAQALDAIKGLENLKDIGGLMKLLIAEKGK